MAGTSFTHRLRTAAGLAGVVTCVCLLPAAPVGAVSVSAGPRVVIFTSDNMLGLSCASTPDVDTVTIKAETSLRIKNQTGHRGTLILDNEPFGEVADGTVAVVLFHRGPVELTLEPQCVLTDHRTVRVQVLGPTNAPSPTEDGTVRNLPEDPSSPPPPPVVPGGDQPSPSVSPTPSASAGAVPADDQGRTGSHSDGSGVGSRVATGSSGSSASAGQGLQGMGSAPEVVPLAQEVSRRRSYSGEEQPLAEPLAAIEPMVNRAPITLLGLLAAICISGVLTGAIRAILSQRSTRISGA